jgi:hypothetical protein
VNNLGLAKKVPIFGIERNHTQTCWLLQFFTVQGKEAKRLKNLHRFRDNGARKTSVFHETPLPLAVRCRGGACEPLAGEWPENIGARRRSLAFWALGLSIVSAGCKAERWCIF